MLPRQIMCMPNEIVTDTSSETDALGVGAVGSCWGVILGYPTSTTGVAC